MKLIFLISCLIGIFSGSEPLPYRELPQPYTAHCIVGEENKYDPSLVNRVPTFTINLDLPPEDRWKNIASIYKQQILETVAVVKNLSTAFFHGKVFDFVDHAMTKWVDQIPQPYKGEILGIAKTVGLPAGEILLYNILYDLSTGCTSIVTEDSNGKQLHARNLDFGISLGYDGSTHQFFAPETLKPILMNINWVKNGAVLYKSANFAGYIGVLNGVKQGHFTISANEKFSINGGVFGILNWLLGIGNAKFMTWAVRDVFETAKSYDEAVSILMKQELISTVYFIVGGVKSGEGAVITRERNKTDAIRYINPKNGTWYLLQTNYDWDKDPLYLDNRREPGIKCMNKLGKENVGFKGIFNVLSSKPNVNKETVYTILMKVDSGERETYVQDCEKGCWFT